MNSVLEEIYSTILPSAPYLIAAYALVWLALLVYVIFSMRRLKGVEAQLALLERSVAPGDGPTDVTASVLKQGVE